MLKSLDNLHHAYLVIGVPAAAEEYIHSFFKSQNFPLAGSPDFFVSKMEVFGIDDARELNTQAVRKSFGNKKIFLISPERITGEAQNALLKTFEDPYPDTHFFLVARGEELILPTLRSRMQVLSVKHRVLDKEAEKFLKLSITGRLDFARKFADDEKNLSVFLDELLSISRSRKVYDMRKFSDDRGAAPRLILEHLALML